MLSCAWSTCCSIVADIAWLDVVVTSAEAVGVRRLIILALVVVMAEVISLFCNTSASISSSFLVASRSLHLMLLLGLAYIGVVHVSESNRIGITEGFCR